MDGLQQWVGHVRTFSMCVSSRHKTVLSSKATKLCFLGIFIFCGCNVHTVSRLSGCKVTEEMPTYFSIIYQFRYVKFNGFRYGRFRYVKIGRLLSRWKDDDGRWHGTTARFVGALEFAQTQKHVTEGVRARQR